jgi:prepilin peptidase CpaA
VIVGMDVMLVIILLGLLILSTISDLRWKKIPNVLTFPVMVIGFVAHGVKGGASGMIYSIEGLFLGMAFLILFYFMGMMGAGDVKLMGAVGSILGPAGIFKAFLFTAIVGGIYALIVLAYHGQLIDFVKRMVLSLKLSLMSHGLALVPNDGKSSPILCYGIAIAIGTSLSLVI